MPTSRTATRGNPSEALLNVQIPKIALKFPFREFAAPAWSCPLFPPLSAAGAKYVSPARPRWVPMNQQALPRSHGTQAPRLTAGLSPFSRHSFTLLAPSFEGSSFREGPLATSSLPRPRPARPPHLRLTCLTPTPRISRRGETSGLSPGTTA